MCKYHNKILGVIILEFHLRAGKEETEEKGGRGSGGKARKGSSGKGQCQRWTVNRYEKYVNLSNTTTVRQHNQSWHNNKTNHDNINALLWCEQTNCVNILSTLPVLSWICEVETSCEDAKFYLQHLHKKNQNFYLNKINKMYLTKYWVATSYL